MEISELKFLGTGSAFNTELGNTSAYTFIEDGESKSTMILFDCGETVFSKLRSVLEENRNIAHLIICITHSHSDHMGSLPTLLYYLHYVYCKVNYIDMKIDFIAHPNIFDIIKSNITESFESEIYKYRDYYNNSNEHFGIIVDLDTDKRISTDLLEKSIRFWIGDIAIHIKNNNNHTRDTYPIYFYIEDVESGRYDIYTGDTNQFPPALYNINYNKCDRIYIDTSLNGNAVHIGIHDIKEALLNISSKPEIICMHLDSNSDDFKILIEKMGFKIAKRG